MSARCEVREVMDIAGKARQQSNIGEQKRRKAEQGMGLARGHSKHKGGRRFTQAQGWTRQPSMHAAGGLTNGHVEHTHALIAARQEHDGGQERVDAGHGQD